MTTIDDNEGAGVGIKMLLAIAVCVVAIWFLVGFGINWLGLDREATAQIGDSFGVVNSLFSGLAFAGVICAILMQRQELRLQRKELALTREVMNQQTEAQEQSGSALTRQVKIMLLSAKIEAYKSLLESTRVERAALNSIDTKHKQFTQKCIEYSDELAKYAEELSSVLSEEA